MKELIKNLLLSLKVGEGGFSGRKLSAFFSVILCGAITYQYIKVEYLTEVLMVWLSFALLCLGIVTIEQIIKLKHDVLNDDKTKE